MADKSLLEQMLERLVNEDHAKAEELFHEYVVAKSREIYENLIESEIADEEEVEEATDDEDEEAVEENFDDVAFEGDDEADQTDGLAGELGDAPEGEEEFAEKDPEELFQDLNAIVDELQAKFDSQGMGGDEGEFGDEEGEEGGNPFAKEEGINDLETVREYVEKVGTDWDKNGLRKEGEYSGTGAQSDRPSLNTKTVVAGKNDMGGTASNIAQSKEEAATYANQGHLKGSSLFKGNPKEDNAGNVNVPGGNAGKTAFKKKEPGHGAEKKGQGEGQFSGKGGSAGSTETTSLFRGRR
jgi:hypothetical protein